MALSVFYGFILQVNKSFCSCLVNALIKAEPRQERTVGIQVNAEKWLKTEPSLVSYQQR